MPRRNSRLKSIDDDIPVYKFAVTGGPCGGKTTAMARLSSFLRERGFRVFTVPEAATLLFSSGASFDDLDEEEQQLQFQINIMKTQIHLEDTFADLATLSNKPSVLLCDRGLMDGSAYISDDAWNELLDRQDMDVIEARDQRYNAVFHLKSAADGATEFYSSDTNDTRLETAEVARELDGKVLRAWVGHPKLFVFDNSTDFEGKLQRVVNAMEQQVGLPTSKRRVKKYKLARCPDASEISVDFEEFDVEKVYLALSEKEGRDHRDHTFVRRRGQHAMASYNQTAVRYRGDGQKIERKRIITAREYSSSVKYLADQSRYFVRQRRYSFLWKGQYFEITNYVEPISTLCILARQVHEDVDEGLDEEFPPWIEVEEEVSGRNDFSGVYVSLRDKSEYDQVVKEKSDNA